MTDDREEKEKLIKELEYNTMRPHLIIPEYGRNVQKMIDYCTRIEDREHRNKVARSIIEVIGNLNPHLRDVPDFKHKLWDHLFIMSDFQLDVDSPYPIPDRETFVSKPELLDYPASSAKYRHYGNIVKQMIDAAAEMDDGDELKKPLILAIANHMKKTYLTWNKDSVEDNVIFEELEKLSNGRIKSSEYGTALTPEGELLRNKRQVTFTKNQKGRNKGGKRKFKNTKNN